MGRRNRYSRKRGCWGGKIDTTKERVLGRRNRCNRKRGCWGDDIYNRKRRCWGGDIYNRKRGWKRKRAQVINSLVHIIET